MCTHLFEHMWKRWEEHMKKVVILMEIVGIFKFISLNTIYLFYHEHVHFTML